MCVKYTVPNISRAFDSYVLDQDNLNLKWNATIHNFRPLQRTFTQVTYERRISVIKHEYSFGLNLTFRGPCVMIYSHNKNQRGELFLKLILVKSSLYMFRTDLLSASDVGIELCIFCCTIQLRWFHPDLASRQST
jgi:hypothetical protein